MQNIKGYKQALKVFQVAKEQAITKILVDTSIELIRDALESRGYNGFTGNTQTSYSCGIYILGKLVHVVCAGDWLKKPIHAKVKKGEFLFLSQPYEGDKRSVYGEVDTNKLSGQQTSLEFLKSFKGVPNDSFGLVMTTGTEYSAYLEKIADVTVLGNTYLRSQKILLNNVKPIA